MTKVQINNIVLLERSCHYHYHQYTRPNDIKNASFNNTRNSLSCKMFILLSIGAEANCRWIAARIPSRMAELTSAQNFHSKVIHLAQRMLHNSSHFSALVCSTISLIPRSPTKWLS